MSTTVICTVLSLATIGMFQVIIADTPVKMADLPQAVRKAAEREAGSAKIKGASKEVEGGVTSYEVETDANGHGRDLSFDSNGRLLSIEEEAPLDAIPARARAAIEKKAGSGKIQKVEKVTEGNKVTYEAEITTRGQRSEFAVLPNGSPVK